MSQQKEQAGYLFDPHVHTADVSPCGWLPGDEMARLYKQKGYHGIVVTDHLWNGSRKFLLGDAAGDRLDGLAEKYLRGYRKAREEGRRIGLTVLWGMELTFDGGPKGDFLVYGFEPEFLKAHPGLFQGDLESFRRLTNGTGAIVYQAHPFRPDNTMAPIRLLDGIEVANGNPRNENNNHRALETALARGLKRIGGSDAHRAEDVGRGGVRLPELPADIHAFVRLLRDGPTVLPVVDG